MGVIEFGKPETGEGEFTGSQFAESGLRNPSERMSVSVGGLKGPGLDRGLG
jgi:hypothetical protein